MAGSTGVRVDGGTVVLHGPARSPVAQMPEGVTPHFHLDASDLTTMTFQDGRIAQWRDKNGGALYATTNTMTGGPYTCPTLRTDYANGRSVVDFGERLGGVSEAQSLKFSQEISKPTDIIVVACDTDELKPVPFFDHGAGGNYFYYRGANAEINVPLSWTGAWQTTMARSRTWVDGFLTDGYWESNGRGLHVYAFSMPANDNQLTISTLANERSVNVGGCRIAELMVFKTALTDAQRADIVASLKAKWLDASESGHYQAEELTTTGSGALEIASGTVRTHAISTDGGAFVKRGAGTLVTDRLSPEVREISVQEGSILFSGTNVVDASPALPKDPYLHLAADDADASHITKATDTYGRIRIETWSDVRGSGHPNAHRWTQSIKDPSTGVKSSYLLPGPEYVANDPVLGKPVIDFGSSVSIYEKPAVAAGLDTADGTLEIKTTTSTENYYREGFYVAAYPKDKGPILGGESANYQTGFHFMPGSPALLSSSHSSGATRGSFWTADGAIIQPLTYSPDTNYHVFRFSAPSKFWVEALATDRGNTMGGFKLAELVLYSRKLTDKERINAEAYLMDKWLKKTHCQAGTPKLGTLTLADAASTVGGDGDAAFGSVAVSGALTKVGAGGLTVGQTTATGLVAAGGVLNVGRVTSVPAALFHIDASDASTLTTQVVGDVTYVTGIADCDGGAMAATNANVSGGAPKLVADASYAQKPYLDFGDFSQSADGAYLKWTAEKTTIREVVLVAGAVDKNAFFLGYSGSAIYDFHRNVNNGALLDNNTNARFYTADTSIDGETCDSHSYPLPNGMHVITMAQTASGSDGRANTFVNDRNARTGGIRLGEAYIFGQRLTDAQRSELVARLIRKWTDPTRDPSSEVVALTKVGAAAGAALRVNDVGSAIADGATLTAGGEMSFSGPLSLGANVTVSYEFGTDRPKPGDYEVLSAGSLTGFANLATWTLAAPELKYPVKFVRDGNSVILRVVPNGLMLIVR